MSDHRKAIIGITIGDVNGIGPEIILKTFADSRLLDLCSPVIYGSMDALNHYKKLLHLQDIPIQSIKSVEELKKNKVNVLECVNEKIDINVGIASDAGGKLAFAALEKATSDVLSEKIDAIVTAPINKKNIRSFYDGFTGHTGYLSDRSDKEALMILCSEKMKIAMVTGHVPMSEVSETIDTDLIIKRIESLNKSLSRDFGIDRPKIAVLGLNPHAGENGLLGKEEESVIRPAIDQVKTKNILAFGPYASDGFFGAANYVNFDGILAMYHVQALIPFKTLSFEDGVNFSANLNFIRTSPDHGTAYEIAGQRKASEASFRQAIYTACDIYKMRSVNLAASTNSVEKSKDGGKA